MFSTDKSYPVDQVKIRPEQWHPAVNAHSMSNALERVL